MQNQGTSVWVYENTYGHPMASNEQNATTFMCSHQAPRRRRSTQQQNVSCCNEEHKVRTEPTEQNTRT